MGAEDGIEVLLLRRSLESVFVGGAHVFPGGAVDPSDREIPADRLDGVVGDAGASAVLGIETGQVDRGGTAFWVAALRECFEEAGVLLARHADGTPLSFADPEVDARFAGHRDDVDHSRRTLAEVCEEEGLRLSIGGVHPFSHWVTPIGAPRRYDTRFFVAAVPDEQVALHDQRETISHRWARPQDALADFARGSIDLILPTQRNLEAIARFETTADLLAGVVAGVAAVRDGRLPLVAEAPAGCRIPLPGDPGWEQ